MHLIAHPNPETPLECGGSKGALPGLSSPQLESVCTVAYVEYLCGQLVALAVARLALPLLGLGHLWGFASSWPAVWLLLMLLPLLLHN